MLTSSMKSIIFSFSKGRKKFYDNDNRSSDFRITNFIVVCLLINVSNFTFYQSNTNCLRSNRNHEWLLFSDQNTMIKIIITKKSLCSVTNKWLDKLRVLIIVQYTPYTIIAPLDSLSQYDTKKEAKTKTFIEKVNLSNFLTA